LLLKNFMLSFCPWTCRHFNWLYYKWRLQYRRSRRRWCCYRW
jgi:hypothetical protein